MQEKKNIRYIFSTKKKQIKKKKESRTDIGGHRGNMQFGK